MPRTVKQKLRAFFPKYPTIEKSFQPCSQLLKKMSRDKSKSKQVYLTKLKKRRAFQQPRKLSITMLKLFLYWENFWDLFNYGAEACHLRCEVWHMSEPHTTLEVAWHIQVVQWPIVKLWAHHVNYILNKLKEVAHVLVDLMFVENCNVKWMCWLMILKSFNSNIHSNFEIFK